MHVWTWFVLRGWRATLAFQPFCDLLRTAPHPTWPLRHGNSAALAMPMPMVVEYTQIMDLIMFDCVCGSFLPFLNRLWSEFGRF
jgi:hypothetical protein